MAKRWVLQLQPEAAKVNSLLTALGIHPKITSLLVQKGIESFEQAKNYFRPSLDDLHDPFIMKGMEKAVYRLDQALKNKEPILIYGDYDVDGVTAVAMFDSFLSNLGADTHFYIPDRATEGYGLSKTAVEWAAKAGFKLLISLDCGIKAHACIQQAHPLGIDVIVCDHHEPGDVLPKAYAILDPKQQDCRYPCKVLSGCGVGFKFLQAFTLQKQLPPDNLYTYLDLVAVSIACDIVPIVGENRILAYHGLKKLNTNPQPGLKALIALGEMQPPLEISQVVFKVGPRLNAAGRIAHASLAVQLLLATDQTTAASLAHAINQQNNLRREVDNTTTEEALAMIGTNPQLAHAKTNVLFKENWHKGVIGIVASRCIEHYYRPTVILTANNGKATGSARSVRGYNIYEAITACEALLEQYGGHAHAAGLTMPLENVKAFQQQFEAVVARSIQAEQLIPVQQINVPLSLEAINVKFYNILKQMAPFGMGNMKAVFVTSNVVARNYSIFKEKDLKLYIQQPHTHEVVEAIGFGLAKHVSLVCDQKPFQIVYTIEESNYRGKRSLQLNLKDIGPPEKCIVGCPA